jgi:hypothetical protein
VTSADRGSSSALTTVRAMSAGCSSVSGTYDLASPRKILACDLLDREHPDAVGVQRSPSGYHGHRRALDRCAVVRGMSVGDGSARPTPSAFGSRRGFRTQWARALDGLPGTGTQTSLIPV